MDLNSLLKITGLDIRIYYLFYFTKFFGHTKLWYLVNLDILLIIQLICILIWAIMFKFYMNTKYIWILR